MSAPDLLVRWALAAVRHGRTVAWTPEWMGFGNALLLALWATSGADCGERRFIRETGALSPWLPVFPGLRPVVLAPSQVRFTDRRVMPWSEDERARGAHGAAPLHEHIDMALVERFINETLKPGSQLDVHLPAPLPDDALVVNVRRGDYYADPAVRRQYGFDVASYLRLAVEGSVEADGIPSVIRVTSDDVGWCMTELQWMRALAPVEFARESGPRADFAQVASARRMVITNSTFSYWAAHLSNVNHGDNHAQVWAPRFFDRTQNGGRSWLLDERWSVVERLPGGWDHGLAL